MNHSAAAQSVFFRLKVRWSSAEAGGIRPVTPIWLDMNNCRTSEYAVPAGPSASHWTWTSNLTGRILSTAGHVHDGGVRTTLTNQTTGQHICTSWAGWGKKAAYQGSIESMSGCTWDRVGTVKKGEVLDLESVYDSPKAVPDAMGIMMAFVYETEDLAAGTPAPPDVRGESPPPVTSTPPPSSHDHH
jgi:stress up-regulated protein Nod 19